MRSSREIIASSDFTRSRSATGGWALPAVPDCWQKPLVSRHDDARRLPNAGNLTTRHGLRNYTLVVVFAGTGARSGELRLTRIDHLNELDKRIVKVS